LEFIAYPDSDALMLGLADRLAGELRAALVGGGRVTLAVPGGTTPGPVFDSLSGAHLDWARVDVMLTDERWVPEASDRSNTRLVRARLLTGPAAAARLIPFVTDDATPEAGLPALNDAVAAALPLTVCLLGMGADMHTASIFPGADRLADALQGDAALVPMRAPGAAEPRLTLSAAVLRGALHRHILITGPDKRAALDRARTLPPEVAPVAAVLQGATVHWAP
jgi:6-phosphogluconolactonase